MKDNVVDGLRSIVRNELSKSLMHFISARSGWVALALAAVAFTSVGCQQSGPPEVQYHYIYRTGAAAVAVPGGGGMLEGSLLLDAAPSIGPADAKVTIVESSDFQCPFCSKGAATMKELVAQYPNDVRVVFVNNPLSFHKEALPAAKAALAAHAQGKFWEYHDLLFQRKQFTEDAFRGFAQELGLDLARWEADRQSEAIAKRIQHEQSSVVALGAGGTPAFFVNGTLVSGAQPIAKFQSEVNRSIEEANKALAEGVKPGDLHRHLAGKAGAAAFVDALIDGKPARAGAQAPRRADSAAARPAPGPGVKVKVNVREEDASKGGGPDAPVTVVEFSEFECPFCSKVGPTLKQIQDEYGDKVRIVFKHMPLAFHKNAKPAAIAAVAAQRQGKFWEYHDILFQNQRALTGPDLERYAEQLGLDMVKFRADIADPKAAAQVEQDMSDASAIGVTGTPTSFVNGRIVKGASPFPSFKAIIDEELGGGGNRRDAAAARDGAAMRTVLGERKVEVDHALGIRKGGASGLTAVILLDPGAASAAEWYAEVDRLVRERRDSVRWSIQLVPEEGDKRGARLALAGYAAGAAEADRALRFLRVLARETELEDKNLEDIAAKAGVDAAKFSAALRDAATLKDVEKSAAQAKALGVKSIPAVFIDGRPVVVEPVQPRILDAALTAGASK